MKGCRAMKRYKKMICVLLVGLFCCNMLAISVCAKEQTQPETTASPENKKQAEQMPQEATPDLEIRAKSYMLMDASTGTILLCDNENEKLFPASMTKIMPLLLVTEAIDSGKIHLNDMVTTSQNAASKGGSQIWLKENETMSVDDLLKAAAVYSANDACTALGEFLAGSEQAFNDMMNQRAQELGMTNTHFDNCTGLDDTTDTHLTTAKDVALMSRELLKHERIINYTTIWMDSLREGQTELVNTNKMVYVKSYKKYL